jgi:hypothetical protein
MCNRTKQNGLLAYLGPVIESCVNNVLFLLYIIYQIIIRGSRDVTMDVCELL